MTAIRLSTEEFDVLWSTQRLGRLPYPLDVPSVGATAAERAKITERVRDGLAERGLWTGRGPDGLLIDLFTVLAAPRYAVDAVGHLPTDSPALGPGGPFRALGAVRDGAGALAVVHADDTVTLRELRHAQLPRAVVDLLPAGQPGPGHAVSVAVAELTGEDSGPGSGVLESGVPNPDYAVLGELAESRVAGGQFGVSAGRSRAHPVVCWFDTAAGRYLVILDDHWLSLAPSDNERITQRLDTILATAP
ncbi:ESX secretion-associated protein EspG [Actinokineospora sp. NBRC 105648]|uniref:ESX secretion-associated protein EspG n=1 Tax=Actinokineospora sp. NBRC 105648 TaxID=3032206 RepID=UPI0024A48372|nr:ESX secretion-associated protein EspG [Actinokineospora sp. NBRC 105648]GLZ38689.1 ESX secretion-associated protein EspG [Actinokineospora sp. NBRC 105648]